MVALLALLTQPLTPQPQGWGLLPNDAVSRKLSRLVLSEVKELTIAFSRHSWGQTQVVYRNPKTFHRWATALARSRRQSGLPDPGTGTKRPFAEGLVRFSLKNGSRVEFPLFTYKEVAPRWGMEVEALYDQAMDRLIAASMDGSPPPDPQ